MSPTYSKVKVCVCVSEKMMGDELTLDALVKM